MLQNNYKKLLVSTLALAVCATPAIAEDGCDLSDGFAASPVAFLQEAEFCLEGIDGVDPKTFHEGEIRKLTAADRQSADRDTLMNLASLNEAARLHAYDMAVRGFAAHEDLEGRGHVDRIHMLDRQNLMGATGANITILPADTAPEDIYKALVSDPENAKNVKRSSFTHMGVGVAEADGKLYVVQLFTRVEGRLNALLPIAMTDDARLSAEFEQAAVTPKSWVLTSLTGDTLDKGRGATFNMDKLNGQVGALSLDVEYNGTTYTMRGPIVSG